jgi:hypothetical protein
MPSIKKKFPAWPVMLFLLAQADPEQSETKNIKENDYETHGHPFNHGDAAYRPCCSC